MVLLKNPPAFDLSDHLDTGFQCVAVGSFPHVAGLGCWCNHAKMELLMRLDKWGGGRWWNDGGLEIGFCLWTRFCTSAGRRLLCSPRGATEGSPYHTITLVPTFPRPKLPLHFWPVSNRRKKVFPINSFKLSLIQITACFPAGRLRLESLNQK